MAKFNVAFSRDAEAVIEKLATKQGTSKAEIVRKAINAYKWLADTQDAGDKIIRLDKTGVPQELIQLSTTRVKLSAPR